MLGKDVKRIYLTTFLSGKLYKIQFILLIVSIGLIKKD